MRFESPLALLLLVFIPLFLEANLRHKLLASLGLGQRFSAAAALHFSSPVQLLALPRSLKQRLRSPLLSSILCTAFLLLVLALARPQTGTQFTKTLSSGRDIMLVLDVSGSMAALDFENGGQRVERLEVLKSVTSEFIEGRKGDRVGLVLFGENVFMQSPLTLDHQLIRDFVAGLEVGMIGDGTSLGDGIAIGLQRVRDIEADSKVLVVVTDGVRTTGQLDPVEAAKIAAELNVRVYTIGIGGSGKAPFRAKDLFGREILQWQEVTLDEKTLKKIAELTGGRYFNAKNTEQLQSVYKAIDTIEEREEQIFEYVEYEEHFLLPLLLGTILFFLHEILVITYFSSLP